MHLPRALKLFGFAAATLTFACSDDESPPPPPDASSEEDAGAKPPDAGELDAGPDGEEDAGPATFGGMTVDTPANAQKLDLFGHPGHRFWFEVSDPQVAAMNAERGGGVGPIRDKAGHRPLRPAYATDPHADPVVIPEPLPPVPGPGPGPGPVDGDIYTPGVEAEATYADHLVVRDAVTGSVADYGKLEVALVGESTFRSWTRNQIPNLRVDTDEFQQKLRVGGFEHFRLNNAIVGSIFREHLAHRVFRELGYPALRSSFAFLGSSVWGEDVWIPMVLMEVYKLRFCEDNQDVLGGTCVNMWEFPGDAGNSPLPSNACQVASCDNKRLDDLTQALAETPLGPGFKAALDPIVDWPRYHAYQCIGWILATGDDAVHATNNNLIIERANDHRLIWAPYSVDISAQQEWYTDTPLLGQATLAKGCQSDPECWADTYAVCEDLVEKFDALDPETFVDETRTVLTEQGMMRAGDEQRAMQLRAWYADRQAFVAAMLPRFRYLPDLDGVCPNDLVACEDGGCGTEAECEERRCPAGQGQYWCEALQYCVWTVEECPSCEAPLFYCPPSQSCAETVEQCTDECKLGFGEDFIFCPATLNCQLYFDCPDAT